MLRSESKALAAITDDDYGFERGRKGRPALGGIIMRTLRRVVLAGALTCMTVGVAAGTAGAAPTGSKNAFVLPATCDGRSVTVVVNSANGRGQGTENNPKGQGTFAPAHVVGSNQVFIPSSFNLVFTFTTPDGQTFSFPLTASHGPSGTSTCSLNVTQTASDGTFSIVGTVTGRFV